MEAARGRRYETFSIHGLAPLDVEMFHKQLPVMRGHLSIVLFRDGIGRGFGAPLERLGFLSEGRCLGHVRLTSTSEIE